MRVLLIGPLPPPHGGGRVSFARFLEYASSQPHLWVTHVDLPVRKQLPDGRYGGVASLRTMLRGLRALARIPFADRVVLFASHGLAFSYGLLLIMAARAFRRPVALRLFGGRPYKGAAARSGPLRSFTEWALSLASSISLQSDTGREDFPESLRSNVTAIRGYRSRITATAQTELKGDTFRFAYAGRVERSKGIDVLIDACDTIARRSDRLKLRVDCYGSPSEEIEKASHNHPIVRLMGVAENDVFRAQLPAYDAFVYPSVYDNEGHPGALIEAMLAGLPIVCTSLPTVMEIVSDGVEALTVEPGSADDLADAIERIVTDAQLRNKLADGSRRRGLTFDENVVIPRLLEEMGLHEAGNEA